MSPFSHTMATNHSRGIPVNPYMAPQDPAESDFKLDLGLLLVRIQKVDVLTRPLISIVEYLATLRRWEQKNHCLIILGVCNLCCFVMPTGYNLFMAMATVVLCGVLGIMHRRSQCLMKVFPNANIRQDDFVSESGPLTHVDVMKQYKSMLFDLDTMVQRYIRYANQLYAVLKWDDLEVSIRWYMGAAVLTLLVHLLPIRWCVTFGLNLFLVEHKAFMFLRNSRFWSGFIVKDDCCDKSDCISVGSQDSPSTELDPMTFSPPELTDSEESDGEKPDTSAPEEDDSDPEDDVGPSTEAKASTSKVGVVGKILEFKKKHQGSTGNCIGCTVQFSTILKRRHICSHCGNHFCSRCCSHKVPRSMFGATSPAAQTETVPVCGFCHMFLTGKKDPLPQDKTGEKDAEKVFSKEQEGEQKEKLS